MSPKGLKLGAGDKNERARRSLWRRLLDLVFGYDFFVSYSWRDGGSYATALARRLEAENFEVFLDRNDFASGDNWKIIGTWALQRTGQLVLVGSPEAIKADPVIGEVKAFSGTGRRIVPIDFDGSLDKIAANAPLAPYLPPEILRIREPASALSHGPSHETIESIRRTFNLVRQAKKRQRALVVVAFVFGILAILAVWQAHKANLARDEALVAQSRLLADKAEALAASGNGTTAALVAMEGLIDSDSNSRPSSAETFRALYSGLYARREIAILTSHSKPLNAIAFSPAGDKVAVGSIDGVVQILTPTGSLIRRIEHGKKITSLTFNFDGTRILSVGEDSGAQQWEVATGQPVGLLMTHDGQVLRAVYNNESDRVLTVGTDGLVKLWNANGSSSPTILRGHTGPVNEANFSPDGKRVVTASDDKSVRIWNADDGICIKRLEGHTAKVRSARFNANGQRIVTASDDRTARLWDVESGQSISLKGHADHVFGASFSPDSDKSRIFESRILTFSEDKYARLWDVANLPDPQQWGQDLVVPLKGEMKHDDWVLSAQFNKNGTEIVTGSRDSKARIWDGQTARLKAELAGHQSRKKDVIASFDPSGENVVTASADGTARLWKSAAGVEIVVLGPHKDNVQAAVFNNDGSLVATGETSEIVRIWNGKTGNLVRPIDVGAPTVWSVAFSPDDKLLATASEGGTVQLWNAANYEWERTLRIDDKEQRAIRTVNFSSDRDWIIFGGYGRKLSADRYTGLAQIWNALTGKPVSIPLEHGHWVQSANFGPHALQVLTASKDGKIRIWNTSDSALVRTLERKDSHARVFSAWFSRDGGRIVSSYEDGTVGIWEKKGDEFVFRIIDELNKPVWTAAFSPDDRWVLVASFDRTARLYDASSGKTETIAVMAGHADEVRSAVFSRDGKRVLTASSDRTARIWPVFLSGEDLIRHTAESVPRCLDVIERKELSLDPDPPIWCITGFGLEHETDPKKWKPKWPYDSLDAQTWLMERRAGRHPAFPNRPER